MRKFALEVTVGDPREDDPDCVEYLADLNYHVAERKAKEAAHNGYFASIYATDGECVQEYKPRS